MFYYWINHRETYDGAVNQQKVEKCPFLSAEYGNVPNLFRIVHGDTFLLLSHRGVYYLVHRCPGQRPGLMASGLSGRLFFDELVI